MRVIPHDDLAEFAALVLPWLAADPVRNNVIATLLHARLDGTVPAEPGIVLWHVADDAGAIAGVAMRTPPMPMLVSDMPQAAALALAQEAGSHQISAFNGSAAVAELIARTVAADNPVHITRRMGRYRLGTVVPPRRPAGEPAVAGPGDLWRITNWYQAFLDELGETALPVDPSVVEREVAAGKFWLWNGPQGYPTAMASASPTAAGVSRIGHVYTPPHLRGNGYASALTAHLGQSILDSGAEAMLFADLANPTSTKIYQAIGFEKLDETALVEIERTLAGPAIAAVNQLAVRWARENTGVASAASVWPLLAILASTADGPARAELTEAIGLPAEGAERAATGLIAALRDLPGMRAALGVWVRDGFPLTAGFQRDIPATARGVLTDDKKVLDSWVHRNTNGRISELPIHVTAETLMVLATALAIKTEWEQPFREGPGRLLTRHTGDLDQVSVVDSPAGLLTRLRVSGTQEIDVHLILGEADRDPAEVLAEAIRSLAEGVPGTPGSQWPQGPGLSETRIESVDPSDELSVSTIGFSVEAEHDLLESAVLFGLTSATDATRGHFPGISPLPLAISTAKQRALAEFTATGFEAAAVTAFGMVAGSAMPQQTFTKRILHADFNRPFAFAAIHRQSRLVLISGWVTHPER